MKVKSIFGFGLLIALAASCALQEPAAPEQDQFPSLSARFENAATKASLDADQMQVVWDEKDQIAVFYHTNKAVCYALASAAGNSSATFAYASGFAAGERIPYVCAYYPYSREVTLTLDGEFSVVWPAEQAFVDGGFGAGSNPMVAVSESETLYFKNIGGYLVVPIWGEGAAIASVTLIAGNDEPLAGPATVYAGPESDPEVMMAPEAVSEIVVKCAQPVTVGKTEDEATEFWFVVPPTFFEEGFGIKIAYADGTDQVVWAEDPDEEYKVIRNTVFRMGALCITSEEEPEDNILFWEGFEGYANEDLPNGWTFFDADGDGYNWYILSDSESGHHFNHSSGDGHLTSASYSGGILYPDNWAITPAIQLASADNYLSFWVAAQDPSYPREKYAVYITTVDPDEAEESDFTLLFGETFGETEPDESITVSGAVERFILPIPPAFNGKTVYIAFRHYDTSDEFRLNLDDVMVTVGVPAPGVPSPDEPDDPNLVFKEDLEGDVYGWGYWDADGDEYGWELDDYYSYPTGSYCFTSRSYYGGALTPDNWLFSPNFTLSSESNWLSFWVAPYMESYAAEKYAVYIKAGDWSMEVDDYTCLQVNTLGSGELEPAERDGSWRRYVLEIPSSLNGKNVHLVFRHYDCIDQFRLLLDYIEVTVQDPMSADSSPAPALPSSITAPYKRLPAFPAPAAPISKQAIQDRPGKPLPRVPFK